MLLKDKFIAYCKNLNNNIAASTRYSVDMSWKYLEYFPFQLQELRQKFTTNTPDDYGFAIEVIRHGNFPNDLDTLTTYQHPFFDMLKLVYDQNLIPNFFAKKRLDYMYQNSLNTMPGEEPQLLLNFLAWSNFDERAFLQKTSNKTLQQQPNQTNQNTKTSSALTHFVNSRSR